MFLVFLSHVFCYDSIKHLATRTSMFETELVVDSISENEDVFLLFLNNEEDKELRNHYDSYTCRLNGDPEIAYTRYKSIKPVPLNFEIDFFTETYYIYVYRCKYKFPDNFTIDYYFQNSWGLLDPAVFPVLIVSFAEAFFSFITMILCFVNKKRHPLIRMKSHTLIMYTVISMFLFSAGIGVILLFINLYHDIYKDQSKYWILADLFKSLILCALIALTLSLASGISTVYEQLSKKTIIAITILTLVFSTVYFFSTSRYSSSFPSYVTYTIAALLIICFVAYTTFFIGTCKNSLLILNAHLCAIAETGVDPLTTPTYRKFKVLKSTRCLSMFLFTLEVMSGLVYSTLSFSFWVVYSIISIVEMAIFGRICYIYRIRKAMVTNYTRHKEETDTYDLNSEYNSNIAVNNNNNENDSYDPDNPFMSWTYGTPLPHMPTGAANPYCVSPDVD